MPNLPRISAALESKITTHLAYKHPAAGGLARPFLIEHKLFSFITMNWRGKPLTSYQTLVRLIASTTTQAGLTVKVRLDQKKYKKGTKVPTKIFKSVNLPDIYVGEVHFRTDP